MRVLLVSIAHFCDLHGGIPRIVQDETVELRHRGCEVWVLAPGAPGQPEYEIQDGVHLLRYVPERSAPWSPARSSGHQKAARAVLLRHLPRVDVVHGHAPLPYLAALDLYGGSAYSSYTVHSPARLEMAIVWRNSGFFRRLVAPIGLRVINRIERECLIRSRAASALSRFTIDRLTSIHGHEVAGKVRLLPGWVDSARYLPVEDREHVKRQLGWLTDAPVLFTLRRLAPRMGLDRLLEACSILKREGIRFHMMIGGTGPLRSRLESQSSSLGLNGVVTFLGRIDDDRLPLAYAACDAFVLPTAELECFGLIAVEALSAGRPVLATPVGAIPEIVSNFDSSWLARSANPGDIADLMRRFMQGEISESSPARLHELSRTLYSSEKRVPEYVEAMVLAA